VLHGERVRLADDAEIVVRQIEAADVRELAIGFERWVPCRGTAGSGAPSITPRASSWPS
jgi:hypothetical protein